MSAESRTESRTPSHGHRAPSSRHRTLAAVLVAIAVVLGTALGAGALASGTADATTSHHGRNVEVVGRVCGPGHPRAGWIDYRASNGERGSVRAGRGWYAIGLHRVAPRGVWLSGTAFCPGPRHRAQPVRFGFFVPSMPVVHRTIR